MEIPDMRNTTNKSDITNGHCRDVSEIDEAKCLAYKAYLQIIGNSK